MVEGEMVLQLSWMFFSFKNPAGFKWSFCLSQCCTRRHSVSFFE